MARSLMYLGLPMKGEGSLNRSNSKVNCRLTKLSDGEIILRLTKHLNDADIAERIVDHAYYEGGYSYKGQFAVLYDPKEGFMIMADENKYWELVRPSTRGFSYSDMCKLRKLDMEDGKFTDEEMSAIQFAAQHRENPQQNVIYKIAKNILSLKEENNNE